MSEDRTRLTLTVALGSLTSVQVFLNALQLVNQNQLRSARYPSLYAAGVRYMREPSGEEDWQTVARTYKRKYGDCEDLAAWRAAELVVSGEDAKARAVLKRIRPGLIHCLVRRGNGTFEDPSKVLGMAPP